MRLSFSSLLFFTACTTSPLATDSSGTAEGCEGGAAPGTYFQDLDADGFGDDTESQEACTAPSGFVAIGGDCDDSRPDRNPGATEDDCTDPVDHDCDGLTDWADADGDGAANEPDAEGTTTWWPDLDGDGFGDPGGTPELTCGVPAAMATNNDDCDDSRADVNPGMTEVCDAANVDEDCDGLADDETADPATMITVCVDFDGDGYGTAGACSAKCDTTAILVADAQDCDDTTAAVNPLADELCDGIDNDCDTLVDIDDDSVLDAGEFWADDDGDGFGAGLAVSSCGAPGGWVADDTDCDDTRGGVNPAATELCDSADLDEDCDGSADDADPSATGATSWYADLDGDTFGDTASLVVLCDAPAGHVDAAGDCDDTDPALNPSATERCDSADVDEDCDGVADDDDPSTNGKTRFYTDSDGDGYGDASLSTDACTAPAGFVALATDCDDTRAGVNPGATELCDSADRDEDCDGNADDDDASASAATMSTFYRDADGDSYGRLTVTQTMCDQPAGYVTDTTDCDDTRAAVNPAGTEVCDAADLDEDCSGAADDADAGVLASTLTVWYLDADSDSYGLTASTVSRCSRPSGYASVGGDCDDSTSGRNPGKTEVCDSADVDEDCDSLADDDDSSVSPASFVTWYIDADGDDHGSGTGATTSACDVPSGYSDVADDCDDTDADVNPDAPEVCFDTVDDDCDGATECTADPSEADLIVKGATVLDYAGTGVGNAGDINGDGVDDLIVGATGDDSARSLGGAAYVVYGGTLTGTVLTTSSSVALTGYDFQGEAGADVTGVGDVNGDGHDDVLIGGLGYGSVGYAYYVRGPLSSGTLTSMSYRRWAGSSGSMLGYSVAAAGDTNGDGKDDFLIGSPGTGGGSASLYCNPGTSGSATATFTAESTSTSYGHAGEDVAGVGDVDGDGYDDIVVGDPRRLTISSLSRNGAAYLLLGPVSGTIGLSSADARITGTNEMEQLGSTVAGGDLNGDGYADLVLGGPGDDDPTVTNGRVLVFEGPTIPSAAGTTADATVTGDPGDFGQAIAANGDADGDGVDDLLIGNPGEVTGSSYVYLLRGPLSGTYTSADADITIGPWADDAFGYRVAYVGNQFGGVGDNVLVGGPNAYTSRPGAAFLFDVEDL